MKHMVKFTALVCCSFAAASLFAADPATGWKQTAGGTYDYNATENWVNGEINGIFGSDLTLEGAQTITFDKNTTFAEGLTIAQTGAFDITFTSNDDTVRTLELAGDFSNTGGGGVVFSTTVNVDLNGANRSFASDKNLTFNGILQNGGVIMTGTGEVHLNAANTYAGGSYFNCSGKVFFDNNSAFGAGTVRFRDGIAIACTKTISISENNPIVFEGDLSYSSKFNSNLGSGTVTFEKPCTFTINNGYTLGIPGQIAGERDWTSVTKSGSGSISTKAPVTLVGGETKEVCVTSGTWYFAGTISGAGTLRKTGGAYLQIDSEGTFNNFSGTFEVAAGSVRFMKKNVLSSEPDVKFLLTGSGVLRSNTSKDCGYAYSAAKLLAYVDTRSTGVLGISSNESGDMDLSNYPELRIAPNGDTFEYSGNIIAPSTGVLRIGGGGKTLKLSGTITGPTEIDATEGSIQFNVSQPGVVGNVTIGAGYTLTVGSSVELPGADIVAEGGTVRFAAATAGTFNRARSVTLNTGTLTVDSPSKGAVVHKVAGVLKTGIYKKGSGGISTVAIANDSANDSTLQVGSIANATGVEMLHVKKTVTGAGAVKVVVDDTTGLALTGAGETGSINAPVSQFVRVDNSLATYDSGDGLRPLNANEYESFTAPCDVSPVTSGANIYVGGSGTATIPASVNVNSIRVDGDVILEAGDQAVLSVGSGAIDVTSVSSAEIIVPLAFGGVHGFISGGSSKKYFLKSSVSGTAGLTIAELNAGIGSTGAILYGAGSSYSGDTYIFGYCAPKSATDFFPDGQDDRTGDVHLYGKMDFNGGSVTINALNGAGVVTCAGSGGSTMSLVGSTDGDYIGTFVNSSSGANFTMYKTGSGKQRFAGALGWKYSFAIENGEFQVDGSLSVNRDKSTLTVGENGVLSGCGTIHANTKINLRGRIVPGSDELSKDEMQLKRTMECYAGCSMTFSASKDRVTQLVCEEAITGSGVEISVTVTGDGSGKWKLLEAPSIEPTFKKASGSGRLIRIAAADSESGNEELWFERESGFGIRIR